MFKDQVGSRADSLEELPFSALGEEEEVDGLWPLHGAPAPRCVRETARPDL